MEKKQQKTLGAIAEMVQGGAVSAVEAQSRRVWMQNFGLITASAAVLWNCGKKSDVAAVAATPDTNAASDAQYYAAALAIENSAIGTYYAAATLPNIASPTAKNGNGAILAIASGFLTQHIAHAGLLQAAIKGLQAAHPGAGIPDPEATAKTAIKVPDATVALLIDDTYGIVNILRLAAAAELSAAQAYISTVAKFTDIANATLNADIGADEAGHYGVLRAAMATLFADTRDKTLTPANIIGAERISTAPAGTAPAL